MPINYRESPSLIIFYGGAVIEVELDTFTGETQVLRADLFCAGAESECVDAVRAQISGSYMMGQGWMLNENVNSHPYAIPGVEEAPIDFRIKLIDVEGGEKKDQKCNSFAEAPVVMAIAAREALKEAVFAYAPGSRLDVDLPVPAGPDAVIRALREISRESAILKRKRKKSGGKG